MGHVFISYQHNDFDFAQVLIHNLEKADFETWIDDHLQGGEDWRVEIDLAIKSAFVLVVIMSPDAKLSEYVAYEWSFALGSSVKVIPVMLKQVTLHARLETLHCLDFTNLRNRPWDKLIDAIKGASYEYEANTLHVPQNTPLYIKQAVIALDSPRSGDRESAVSILAETKHPIAHQALKRALQHPLSDVRSRSAEALGQMKDVSAVSALIDALKDTEGRVRSRSAEALGQMKDVSAVPALIDALKDTEGSVRREAAESLGEIGDTTAVPALIDALKDTEAYVRSSIASALSVMKDIQTLPIFVGLLQDKEHFIRIHAINALCELRDRSTIPALIESTKDPDLMVSRNAITTLGVMKDMQALPSLIGFLREIVELEIAREASKTQKRSKRFDPFKYEPNLHKRSNIIEAIENFGEIAIPHLEEVLQHSNESDAFRKQIESILNSIKKV